MRGAALASAFLDAQADASARAAFLARAQSVGFERLPASAQEHEFDCKGLDKVFALEWLDASRVLAGTKCNRLLCLDVETGSIARVPLPPTPPRPWSIPHTGWGPCGIHAVKINAARDLLATGGRDPTDAVVLRLDDGSFAPVATLVGHQDWVFGMAWASDRHIITGSRDQSVAIWRIPEPAEAAALALEQAEAEAAAAESAGAAVSAGAGAGAEAMEADLASGGPSFPTWLGEEGHEEQQAAEQQQQEHEPPMAPGAAGLVQLRRFVDRTHMKRKFDGKVRDVAFCNTRSLAAALDTSGCVKLLDPQRDLRTTRVVRLEHKKELVCMALRADLLAVGSAGHVEVVDPRSRRDGAVVTAESPDEQQGVRSVCLQDHLLSFGTGLGKICFWDLRAQAFVPTEPSAACFGYGTGGLGVKLAPTLPTPALQPRHHLQTGAGWLAQNETYFEHFSGLHIHNACYAHAWCPSRRRLIAAGGPLAYGLKGCYAALWE